MRPACVALTLAIAAAALPGALSRAADSTPAESSHPGILYATRVLYLQGMDLRDAMTQLRSLDVRRVAIIKSRSALVVSDVAERVDQAVDLLQEKKALVRVAEPHPHLYIEQLAQNPTETHVFRIDGSSMESAVTVLRAIYQVRELQKSEQDSSVTVKASRPILDASESLLGELGLLVEPRTTSATD